MNDIEQQNSRMTRIMSQVKKVKSKYNDILLSWDSNIDLLEGNDPCGRFDIKYMYDHYLDTMALIGGVQMNFEATRHRVGQRSSLLDHCFATNPTHIDNVETILSHISDHSVVKWQYHCEELKFHPQFIKTRKFSNLTREVMLEDIRNNVSLNAVLSNTNTDQVTNTIITEYNDMINRHAPATIIQVRADYMPFYNEEIKEQNTDADIKLSEAILVNEKEKWNIYKMSRNKLMKLINTAKTNYYERILNSSLNIWKSAKHLTNSEESTVPRRIVSDGKVVTSPKKLANCFNVFFKEKIRNIQKSFFDWPLNPLFVLSLIIPRKECRFCLPETTVEEVENIIRNMKSSNGVGFDNINTRIIKKIPEITAVFVCHLINTAIQSNKYPEMLKITRILPLSKAGKNKDKMDSFRPVCNAHTFDKIFQEHIKCHIFY